MIDFSKEYKIESKPIKNDSNGLDRYGIAMYPGTVKRMGVSFDEVTKKYTTGLDEYHPSVTKLPTVERDAKVEWIKKTREALELQIGSEGVLDAKNSDFWDVWRVNLEVGEDRKVKLNGSHPYFNPTESWNDKLSLITLEAMGAIPLSKKEATNPIFKDAKFLVTSVEEEVTFTKESIRKTRLRATELGKLFEGETANYERAFNISYLMDLVKEQTSIDKLEELLEGITHDKEYLEKFLDLCKLDDAEIALRVVVKKAIYYDIIKYSSADQVYFKGGINFRKTESSTTEYLKQPEMAREVVEIKEEVRKKESKMKKNR